MARREKPPEPGCPMWLATYGDLVTNLLVFFVLLMSMSEIKQEDRLMEVLGAIREAFGATTNDEVIEKMESIAVPANVNWAEMLDIPVSMEGFAETDAKGIDGRSSNVETRRPTQYFAIGAPISFEQLSAELSAEQRAALLELVETIRGYNTLIEVRGHASSYPVEGSAFSSHFALAFSRAEAVAAVLLEAGIDPQRVLVASAGTNQPISPNAYGMWQRKQNDLVELLQTDNLVQEFRQP